MLLLEEKVNSSNFYFTSASSPFQVNFSGLFCNDFGGYIA